MKRRQKNEGTIFWSTNESRWVAQFTLPDGRKRSKFGKTQAEVKKWLLDERKALQDGNYLTGDSYTVESFIDRYLKDIAVHNLAPKTLITYNFVIKKHIVSEIGGIKLKDLRPDRLQSLYTKKLNEGKSPRTVQKIHNIIHMILQLAYSWGLVLRNVADLVKPPQAEKKVPIVLTVTQINQLLDAVKGTREYALYACAASLGLRRGEILALLWEDISFEKRTVTVNKQIQSLPGLGIVVSKPKTSSSVRTLPLPDVAIHALEAHRMHSNGPIVFATSKGTYFSPRNVLRDFQVTLERLGLPIIPFHNLRHSCASYHLAVGTNPKIVQELLGHSSVSITLNTYSHLLPGVSEEATARINQIFT